MDCWVKDKRQQSIDLELLVGCWWPTGSELLSRDIEFLPGRSHTIREMKDWGAVFGEAINIPKNTKDNSQSPKEKRNGNKGKWKVLCWAYLSWVSRNEINPLFPVLFLSLHLRLTNCYSISFPNSLTPKERLISKGISIPAAFPFRTWGREPEWSRKNWIRVLVFRQ